MARKPIAKPAARGGDKAAAKPPAKAPGAPTRAATGSPSKTRVKARTNVGIRPHAPAFDAPTDTRAPRAAPSSPRALDRVTMIPALPPRPREGHKATFGHVLVLAGSYRYTGAAVLTARATLRSGAGLVTLGCPKSAHAAIAAHLLCEMSLPLADAAPGVFAPDAVSEALDWAERANAVALGPGIATDTPAMRFAQDMAVFCPLPMVIDADGISALVGAAQRLEWAEGRRVLTPHPGEAARLLSCSTAEVMADREGAAIRIARETNSIVLIKGAGTIVTDAERVYVNASGNPGMATAGSGDVLTGVIAALLAQGMDPFDAACLGAHLHGRAGDLAARALGEHGMIATDILESLPLAFRDHATARA
ncbi:MAG: NAD(P)H-hydrate dehydratase [Planctomycetes bacterium]|nr:NAD(P)H-hydrate dehydratase [Planctomycetota bacterium]